MNNLDFIKRKTESLANILFQLDSFLFLKGAINTHFFAPIFAQTVSLIG